MAQCQAAVAEAVTTLGGIDILFCCESEGMLCWQSKSSTFLEDANGSLPLALIGTIEELAASPRTQSLAREQFESTFYSPINCVKAVLPTMREHGGGHIIILSGTGMFPSFLVLCFATTDAL